MTATLPSVVAADDLIVRSAPRNQRASPSSGWSAMTVGDASCASRVDMGASLPTRGPFVQLRRETGVAACVTSLRRSAAEREPRLFGRIVRRAAAGRIGRRCGGYVPRRPGYRIEAERGVSRRARVQAIGAVPRAGAASLLSGDSARAVMGGGFAGSLIGGGSLHRSQWPELLGQVQHRRGASGAVAEAAAVDGD